MARHSPLALCLRMIFSENRSPLFGIMLIRERYCIHMTAIIGLGAMGGAAKTVELRRVRIGAVTQVLDLSDAGALEPRDDEAGQIEHGVARSSGGREEALAVRIGLDEAIQQIGADFVIVLSDHRTERGGDTRARGAELLHRSDGG